MVIVAKLLVCRENGEAATRPPLPDNFGCAKNLGGIAFAFFEGLAAAWIIVVSEDGASTTRPFGIVRKGSSVVVPSVGGIIREWSSGKAVTLQLKDLR